MFNPEKNTVTRFRDSPSPEELDEAVDGWYLPELPEELKYRIPPYYRRRVWDYFHMWYRIELESLETRLSAREKIEKTVTAWLYDLIRLNVKRGRFFDLLQVLRTGNADCLGYAKLFVTLGRRCGLDLGIVEVIIDNRGCRVPHTATLVRMAGGRRRFIDFWYGSRNIRHKRLGLQVKREGLWRIEDIDYREIKKAEDISFLPDDRVDAITLYIEGNRHLKQDDYTLAIDRYSESIRLYPQNARTYYNRAIAFEKLGQPEKAQADYARALQDETALCRTLAAQPEDVVDLARLDEKFIPELDQQIFLLHTGFITGKEVSPAQIAKRLDIPPDEVEAVLSFIKKAGVI